MPFYLQVVLFDILPMRVLPPLFFVAIAYPMIGLRPLGLYWAKTLLVSGYCSHAACFSHKHTS